MGSEREKAAAAGQRQRHTLDFIWEETFISKRKMRSRVIFHPKEDVGFLRGAPQKTTDLGVNETCINICYWLGASN